MTSTQTKAKKPGPDIKMHPVAKSSNILATGYDPHSKTLAVQFRGGGRMYHYSDVPQGIYDGLGRAESIGKFIVGNIAGKFKHTAQQKAD